ncbi:MAG: CorA family divalent cation transporter [Luteolibacter sp.]
MKRKPLNWTLPPEIEARLGEGTYGRQRTIAEADHLLIILHHPPVPDRLERDPALFLRKPDGSMLANGYDQGGHKLRKLLGEYRQRWEECDNAYDSAETAGQLLNLLETLAPLNRSSTNLAGALQAARDASKSDKFLISMRDESEEISRAFELLTSDAKLKLDYRIASNSEAQAEQTRQMIRAQHRLNVLAAITLPLMALATIFGMNVSHGLEERTPLVFVLVLALGLTIGLFVKRWVAR